MTLAEARAALKRSAGELLFDCAPYAQQIQRTAEEFGITIYPCRSDDGRANASRKEIYAPWPPTSENDIAETAHELAHCIQPACSGRRPLHFGEVDRRGCYICVGCEVQAWAIAITLLRPHAWTRKMHDQLNFALGTYRRRARAWPAATAQLDKLSGNLTYCKLKQEAVTGTLPKGFRNGK